MGAKIKEILIDFLCEIVFSLAILGSSILIFYITQIHRII